MKRISSFLAVLSTAAFTPLVAQPGAAGHSNHQPAPTAAAAASAPATSNERVGDPWPLDTCIVSGGKLGSMGDPIIRIHEGREVRFCCEGCVPKFEADPAPFLKKADEAIKQQQRSLYPLDHCIIDTTETISADDSENSFSVVGNRLFIYCCPPCDKKVRQDPAKYIAILDEAAIAKQKADYPLTTCVVSGQALGSMGEPVDVVIAGQLVRLCCKGCESKLEADPAAALAKVADSRKAKAATSTP